MHTHLVTEEAFDRLVSICKLTQCFSHMLTVTCEASGEDSVGGSEIASFMNHVCRELRDVIGECEEIQGTADIKQLRSVQ